MNCRAFQQPQSTLKIVGSILACALVAGCGQNEQAGPWEHTYETEASVCQDGPPARTLRIDTDARAVGSSSNALLADDDGLWVVESGENTLTPVSNGPVIDVGDGNNPYDAAYDAGRDVIYVTNFLTDTVTVADATSGEVLDRLEHPSFDGPNGIAVSESYVYVTNSGFRSGRGFADGSVTVIDAATRGVLGAISTARKNPQFATWAQTSEGPRLIVVNTGELTMEAGDFSAGPAAVEIWAETPDPLAPEKRVAALDVPSDPDIGAPGRASVTADGSRAYFTSATAPVLFELDLETGEWNRGAEDPIELYDAEGDALDHAALGHDGVLYVSAFNSEQLLLYDTRCDHIIGRYDISANDTLNSGPHSIAIDRSDAASAHGYIIGSISNALIEFEVE
jgi:DNA-binding beta-propeller fold protein YncE